MGDGVAQEIDAAADEQFAAGLQLLDAGVLFVGGAEDVLGVFLEIPGVDVLHLHGGDHRLLGLEDDGVVLGEFFRRLAVHRQDDGQRPGVAAGQPAVLHHLAVVFLVHEALQRGENPGGDVLDFDGLFFVDLQVEEFVAEGEDGLPFLRR